ncbi:MAG: hypothetical protein ICV63_05720 [Coleofasciculus sp. Co-bin14]|nr:hypothetical protein [Coleofasciculus sp. Co-bin14]
MNNYFNAFENIDQSVEQLLTDEHNSLEIKESAISLRKSVEPCFEELKQSASRLKRLILVGSDELYRAENVWLSKQKIAEAAKQQIWEQLGEISGRTSRIRILGNQCKSEALKQAKESWDEKVERLIKKWFINNQNQIARSLSWADKDRCISELTIAVNLQIQELYSIIPRNLRLLYKEWQTISTESIRQYISILDSQSSSDLNNKFNLIVSNIESEFTNQLNLFISDKISNQINALAYQNMFGLEWERFVNFKAQVEAMIENTINSIFKERVELVTEALEQAIAFYNYFLERQERYQQETPEQREAEKAWIDQQRRELEQVQHGIEAILNAS